MQHINIQSLYLLKMFYFWAALLWALNTPKEVSFRFRSFVLSFSLRVFTWKTKQTLGVCNILPVHEVLLCNNRTLWLVHISPHFKTFNKFCNVFRGALIDCKRLQSISKSEMLADICVSLFEMLALVFFFSKSHDTWWVSARYYEKKF